VSGGDPRRGLDAERGLAEELAPGVIHLEVDAGIRRSTPSDVTVRADLNVSIIANLTALSIMPLSKNKTAKAIVIGFVPRASLIKRRIHHYEDDGKHSLERR
jgi:hypothetical protein